MLINSRMEVDACASFQFLVTYPQIISPLKIKYGVLVGIK